ncbi:MAG: hypothetical protein DRJ01_02430 [Bacteroidetes bacterium]|nr:MAG: hypothetical protein DRJ01_02430 [Bacteroidota bacterium]
MFRTLKIPTNLLLLLVILVISQPACKNKKKSNENVYETLDVDIDSSASKLVKFNNTLFSVPSPYQLALLVKQVGTKYNKGLLNPTQNQVNYSSNFKKALNLGVYGADLTYLNIYEQIPDAVNYFSVIKTLSQDLALSNAFEPEVFKSIEKNMGNKDSLLHLFSNTYRKADAFLKNNERNQVAVLIITGGWVEGLYLLTQTYKENKNQEILNRIGENKQPLENLIKILSPYYDKSDDYSKLIDGLIDLAYDFDGVEMKYTYIEPTVDTKNKISIINSKSELLISDNQLTVISDKIKKIRNDFIN